MYIFFGMLGSFYILEDHIFLILLIFFANLNVLELIIIDKTFLLIDASILQFTAHILKLFLFLQNSVMS